MANEYGAEFMDRNVHTTHLTDGFNRFTSGETAKWWLTCDDFNDESIQLYNVVFPTFEANTTLNAFGEMTSNGAISVGPVTVEIRNNAPSVVVMNYLTTGKNVGLITIERIANIETNKVILQTVKFNTCHITRWNQQDDSVWFSFTFEKISNDKQKYKHNGELEGNVVATFDVREMESTRS